MNNLSTCNDVDKSQKKHVIKRNQTHKSTRYMVPLP